MTFATLLHSKVVRAESAASCLMYVSHHRWSAKPIVMRQPMDFSYTLYDAGRRPALPGEGRLVVRRLVLPERLWG